jgi:hypothetical protein
VYQRPLPCLCLPPPPPPVHSPVHSPHPTPHPTHTHTHLPTLLPPPCLSPGDLASPEHRAALDLVVHQYASRVECLAGTAAPSLLSPPTTASPSALGRPSPKKAFVFAYSDPGAGAVVAPFGVVAFREVTRLVECGSEWRRAGDPAAAGAAPGARAGACPTSTSTSVYSTLVG